MAEMSESGCCDACGGKGGNTCGPCWDCRGTGCAHPDPCTPPATTEEAQSRERALTLLAAQGQESEALDRAYERGLAEGEARVRARVEAVLDRRRDDLIYPATSNTSERTMVIGVTRIRAALAADTPQNALPQGSRIDAQGLPGVVAHSEDSRPPEQYDSE